METLHRSTSYLLLALAVLLASSCAHALGPAGHYVVMEKVTQALPAASALRQAMAQHPDIAGAAASGPDIPYCQLRGALGYAPWADRFHYDRVGSFASAQLRRAFASGDSAQLAWAAGWVTHVTADMAVHGLYVNPEAGVYLENAAGRGLHKQLESAAEAVVWVDFGGRPAGTYSTRVLPGEFCGNSALPIPLMTEAATEVFGRSPGDYRTWYRLFKTGLETGLGYTYLAYPEAQRVLNTSDRRARLTQAVEAAVKEAVVLLQAAEKGDYAGFSDAWNLDAAKGGRPFGTLTVTVRTSDRRGAGTDADIYFGMVFADGTSKEWLLDKEGYNDFEQGDLDDYYLFLADPTRDPAAVTRVFLRMGREHGVGVAWRVASVSLRLNGRVVRNQDIDVSLNHEGDQWEHAAWNAPKQ